MRVSLTMHSEVTPNTHPSTTAKRPEMPIPLSSLLFRIPILVIHPAHVIPFLWLRIYVRVTMHTMCLSTDSDTTRNIGELSECARRVGCHSWLATWNCCTE